MTMEKVQAWLNQPVAMILVALVAGLFAIYQIRFNAKLQKQLAAANVGFQTKLEEQKQALQRQGDMQRSRIGYRSERYRKKRRECL